MLWNGCTSQQSDSAPINNVPDLLADSKIWKWGGVSFGDYDTMLLQKSLKALLKKLGATCSQMRLWGKIKCTERDYYVTEGVVDAGE